MTSEEADGSHAGKRARTPRRLPGCRPPAQITQQGKDRRLKVAGDERYHDEPNKNGFSHVHDALQYALSGGGETLRPRSTQGPIVAETAFKVLP
jgi:hypothetical protein